MFAYVDENSKQWKYSKISVGHTKFQPIEFPTLFRQNNVMLNVQLLKVDEPTPKNLKYHDQVGVVSKLICQLDLDD